MPRILPPLRTLLPAEHGSWFMLGFPLVLGLLLRPTLAGLCLGLAALAFFLGRPSLRRVLTGQRDPLQIRALLLFGALAGGLGGLTLLISGPQFLIPLACVAPLVVLALRADLDRAVRTLAVELAAQGAFAGLAAAILAAGGGSLPEAGLAWLFVTLVGATLTTFAIFTTPAGRGFIAQLAVWLWFTVLFANLSEALAEGRGKAQADALRRARKDITAKRLKEPTRGAPYEIVPSTAMRRDCRAGIIADRRLPGYPDIT